MEKQKPSGRPTILREGEIPEEELSAFERWELPAMDDALPAGPDNPFSSNIRKTPSNRSRQASDIEDADDDEIKPLTAEDLEAIRQAAYEEGKQQGQQEGYKAGYDQGYKSGESDLKAAITKLSQISRALLEPISQHDQELEEALLSLVENICGRVVHRELVLDSSSLLKVVKEALNCLNPGAKSVRIHLNPQDAEFVEQSLKDIGEWDESWRFLAHQTISPGGCIVDTDNAVIDMRAEKRLATMIKQVYEQDPKALEEDAQQDVGLDQLMNEVDAFQEDELNEQDDSDGVDDELGSEP